MLEAERPLRRTIGHTDLAKLAVAIERDRQSRPHVTDTSTEEPLRSRPPAHHTPTATAKFHGDWDILVLSLGQPLERRGSLP
jgi:hypothetical protein